MASGGCSIAAGLASAFSIAAGQPAKKAEPIGADHAEKMVKGLDLSASVYNLLDKRYSDPSSPFHQQASIEQNGRSFRVKLTYRF